MAKLHLSYTDEVSRHSLNRRSKLRDIGGKRTDLDPDVPSTLSCFDYLIIYIIYPPSHGS